MNYNAGELDFSLLKNKGFQVYNGDIVKLSWNNKKVFYGYVFKYSIDENNKFNVTAYDTMRYLKNPDSLVLSTSTLSQRFNQICKIANLNHKVINGSSVKLHSGIFDNKSYFEMLSDSIDATKKETRERFFIIDNYGRIELRKYPYMRLKLRLGDNSLVTSYNLERSIDNSANLVKVVREDNTKRKRVTSTKKIKSGKNKGKTKTTSKMEGSSKQTPSNTRYTSENATSSSVDRWGQLVYVDKPTDKLNSGQMKSRAEKLLKQKNKQENTLKLTCLGNLNLIPGNSVRIGLYDLKSAGIGNNSEFLIESVTHYFEDNYKTDLELKI